MGGIQEPRREHVPDVAAVAALEHVVEAVEHLHGADVGEKAQPAAIDAEQRHVAIIREPRGVQQRAVAADRDQELGAAGERILGQRHDALAGRDRALRVDEHLDAAPGCMGGERLHRLRDQRVREPSDERDGLETGIHERGAS